MMPVNIFNFQATQRRKSAARLFASAEFALASHRVFFLIFFGFWFFFAIFWGSDQAILLIFK